MAPSQRRGRSGGRCARVSRCRSVGAAGDRRGETHSRPRKRAHSLQGARSEARACRARSHRGAEVADARREDRHRPYVAQRSSGDAPGCARAGHPHRARATERAHALRIRNRASRRGANGSGASQRPRARVQRGGATTRGGGVPSRGSPALPIRLRLEDISRRRVSAAEAGTQLRTDSTRTCSTLPIDRTNRIARSR